MNPRNRKCRFFHDQPRKNSEEIRKERAEACWRMAEAAAERYKRRHGDEWRMNLAYWTPLLLGSAYLVTLDQKLPFPWMCLVILITVVALVLYIWLWNFELYKMNCNDIQKNLFWQNRYLSEMGFSFKQHSPEVLKNLFPKWGRFPKDGDEGDAKIGIIGFDDIETKKWPDRPLRANWSFKTQILVSFFLSLSLICSASFAYSLKENKANESKSMHSCLPIDQICEIANALKMDGRPAAKPSVLSTSGKSGKSKHVDSDSDVRSAPLSSPLKPDDVVSTDTQVQPGRTSLQNANDTDSSNSQKR